MIVTQEEAKRIIRANYSADFKFKLLSRSVQIGVRPNYETGIGLKTLVWTKLDRGKDSAVKIGRILPDLSTDWNWQG